MRIHFLILFLAFFTTGSVSSQSPDWDQRIAFGEKVQKIKFWAYIDGDSTFRCYSDAVNAIEDVLNRKGYEYKRLFFEPRDTLSLLSWKARQIKSLAANEAFLEIRVSIRTDSSDWAGPGTLMVQDASGSVYAQHNLSPETIKNVEYTSTAEASLYLFKGHPDSTTSILFYSKKIRVSNPGIGSAATISLKGIPSSRHPVSSKKPAYLNKGGTTISEFAFYGGFCAGASISITGGKAAFEPGPDYGIEFMVNIYKGLDIGIGYKREDTFAKVSSYYYSGEGDLALSNNYILLSSIYRFFHSGRFQPYVGFDFGSVNMVMKDKILRDVWYFTLGGRAGLCLYVTRVLGFRLQTQLLYQVHSTNAPFLYSDDYTKMPYPINASSSLPQFDATLGILIRLGK